MHAFERILPGMVLASVALIGCGAGDTAGEPAGSSQARFVVMTQESGAASLQITATLDETAEVAFDRAIEATAGEPAIFDIALAPGTYTIHVHVFADGSHAKLLGSSDAHAELVAGGVTDINLHAHAKGGVSIAVDQAPQIEGVAVTATADGGAQIHVDATDAEGQPLTFYWSGLGVDGAVVGSSTLTVSAAALAEASGPPIVRVVVQDSGGATAVAQVVITPEGGQVAAGASAGESASAQACADARAACSAQCSATLVADPLGLATDASCQAACAISLATCEMP